MDRDVGRLVELRKHQGNDVEAQQDETETGAALRFRDRPDVVMRPAGARANQRIARGQLDRRTEDHVGRDVSAARSVRAHHHAAVFVAHDGALHLVGDRRRAAVRMREAEALERLQRHPPRLQQPHGERLQRSGYAIGLSLALARRTDEGQRIDGGALGNQIVRDLAVELAKAPGVRIEERGDQPIEMAKAPAAEFALRPHHPDRRSRPHGRGGEIEHDARRSLAGALGCGGLRRRGDRGGALIALPSGRRDDRRPRAPCRRHGARSPPAYERPSHGRARRARWRAADRDPRAPP